MQEKLWPVRVYYEDTDSGGVVYHANYLRFFERGRTEWLRAYGFEQDRLSATEGVLFAVRNMTLDFVRAARFNDMLWVATRLESVKKASLEFFQRIILSPELTRRFTHNNSVAISLPADITRICEAHVRIACLDSAAFKPRPIPRMIVEEIQRAQF